MLTVKETEARHYLNNSGTSIDYKTIEINTDKNTKQNEEDFNITMEAQGSSFGETMDKIDFNVLSNFNEPKTLEGLTAKEIIDQKVKEHYNKDFMDEAQKIQKDIISKAKNNDLQGLMSIMRDKFTNQEILNFAKSLGVSTKSNAQKAKDKAKRKIASKSKRINRK